MESADNSCPLPRTLSSPPLLWMSEPADPAVGNTTVEMMDVVDSEAEETVHENSGGTAAAAEAQAPLNQAAPAPSDIDMEEPAAMPARTAAAAMTSSTTRSSVVAAVADPFAPGRCVKMSFDAAITFD